MSGKRHRKNPGAEVSGAARPEDLPTVEHTVPEGEVGVDWRATAIGTSQPPVRILGSERRWRGGFRVDR